MASKLCDSCKSATATLFCRADSAFLCINCDSNVHAANKLASRHARVWVCEVCEQAPAHVTCKADAAALCVTCDSDIHSANPLARRHERVPVTPFYELVGSDPAVKPNINFLDDSYLFSDVDGDAVVSREEVEAASWLLPNHPNPKMMESPDLNTNHYVFSDMEPYMDLDYGPSPSVYPKLEAYEQNDSTTDGVVPVQSKSVQAPLVNDHYFGIDFTASKPLAYGYNTQSECLSHTVSSSYLDVGVVPDGGNMMESTNRKVQLSAVDREARVLRYKEKRKNRKFEKTIRYASRKAYAEMRPRIKGRFTKRSNSEVDRSSIYEFGVVPSF